MLDDAGLDQDTSTLRITWGHPGHLNTVLGVCVGALHHVLASGGELGISGAEELKVTSCIHAT